MTKLDQQTEANVLRIVHKYGQYNLNPLAYRNRKKLIVAESMAKRGLITKHSIRTDYTEYRDNVPTQRKTHGPSRSGKS